MAAVNRPRLQSNQQRPGKNVRQGPTPVSRFKTERGTVFKFNERLSRSETTYSDSGQDRILAFSGDRWLRQNRGASVLPLVQVRNGHWRIP